MGCWNGTCGLSNLPIHAGEPVVAYLVAVSQHIDPNGSCYSMEPAYPVSLPIRARYNDYGSIEEVNLLDPVVQLTAKAFGIEPDAFEEWVGGISTGDVKLKYNPYQDPNKGDTMIPLLEKQLAGGEITQEDMDKYLEHTRFMREAQNKVGLWMARADVYDAFAGLDKFVQRGHIGALRLLGELQAYVQEDTEDLEGIAPEHQERAKQALKRQRSMTLFSARSWSEHPTEKDYNDPTKPRKVCYDNPFTITISDSGYAGAGHATRTMEVYRDWMLEQVQDGGNIDPLVLPVIQHGIVSRAIERMRMTWLPNSGRGSQSECYEWNLHLAETIVSIATSRAQGRRLDDEEN